LRDSGFNDLKYLKVTRTASQIFYIEPNNPPVNALRSEMLTDFEKVAEQFSANPPRCIVLRCDVAGANIKEMQNQTPEQSEAYANRAKAAFRKLRSSGAPIIGFTTKFAIGGGLELLMHADIRYSGPKALIQAPEVELDTFQSFGGTYLLPKFLGSSLALRAQLRSDKIDLQQAVQHGLLTDVVSDPDPEATIAKAFDDATVIARKKPSVVYKNVQMVRLSEIENVAEVCKKESHGFGETFAGGALGMKRFLEKYRLEEWGPDSSKVIHGEFKALGIDLTQVNSFIEIIKDAESDNNVRAVFLCGDVSGGDIKKLYSALVDKPSDFSEFLAKEYLWHELMRTHTKKPIFYFGRKILGGGGLGVFNSCDYKICTPDTIFMMPEIELGTCPDVAGTYDLSRLGSVGRAMAISGIDLNGSEAKEFGLTDYLVPAERMEHLKETLLDSVVEGSTSVSDVLNEYSVAGGELRHTKEQFDEIFGREKSLKEVVELVKNGKDNENSVAKRAFEKMSKASTFGIVLSDVMNSVGKDLELKEARALEFAVWTNMDTTDFKESVYSRFILPRKERRSPKFVHPNIFEMSANDLDSLRNEVVSFVESQRKTLSETQNTLFSSLN